MTSPHAPIDPVAGADRAARAIVARAVAAALFEGDIDSANALATPGPELIVAAWDVLRDVESDLSPSDLSLGEVRPRTVSAEALVRWLGLSCHEREAARYAVFGLVISRDCPAYETEYIPSRDAATRAQHLADLCGFFAAFGVAPDPTIRVRSDHVSLIAGFVSVMLGKLRGMDDTGEREGREVCAAALQSFLRDHVIWWMPTFAHRVERRIVAASADARLDVAAHGALCAFAGTATLLRAWVGFERRAAGLPPARRIVEPDVDSSESCDDSCGDCPEAAAHRPAP